MPHAGGKKEPQVTSITTRSSTHEGDGSNWVWANIDPDLHPTAPVQEDTIINTTGEHTPEDSPAPTAGQRINPSAELEDRDCQDTQSLDLLV